jgi:hypothetical protein
VQNRAFVVLVFKGAREMPDSNKLLYEEHCAVVAAINAFALETADPEIADQLYALVEHYNTKPVAFEPHINSSVSHRDGGAVR